MSGPSIKILCDSCEPEVESCVATFCVAGESLSIPLPNIGQAHDIDRIINLAYHEGAKDKEAQLYNHINSLFSKY